jgi:ADP-ribose pyrophosphatase YjhB (NUDIX family)
VSYPVLSTPVPHLLPATEYYASLPKQIASAGVIIHDGAGRIMLVRPSYSDETWEIPGGALDAGEDPWRTARREVKEELGLDLMPGRLLVVDWAPEQDDGRPALVNFVFDGGALTLEQADQHVKLNRDELAEWQFTTDGQWDELLIPRLARRLRACSQTITTGITIYLHDGWDPGQPEL